jgi:Ca2+-binding EF-hand superfamily protein
MKRKRLALGAVLAAMACGAGSVARGEDASSNADAVFKKLDKNGDGKLSASEIPDEQSRFFERLVRLGDKNADGELTLEEFQQANKPEERPNVPLGAQGAGNAGGMSARQRFEMLDRNKDGKITLEEVPEPLRDRLKPVFERAGKQELTLDDYSRLGAGGAARPEPGEFFKRLDTNDDGKLSRDEIPAEFRERMTPLFERLGKDEITREEFVQISERLRGAAGGRPEQPGAATRPAQGNPEAFFARLDANSDGKVTVDEAPERAKPMVENMLRRAGKERDGGLTREEFLKYAPTPPRDGASPRKAEGNPANANTRLPDGATREGERRSETDRPRDGERRTGAAASEVREGNRRQDGPPQEGLRPAIIRILDTNNDGHLSKDELSKIADKFDELDKNHDGQLDPFELIGGPQRSSAVRGERRPEGERSPTGDGRPATDERRGERERTPADERRSDTERRGAEQSADARRRDGEAPHREGDTGRGGRNAESTAIFDRLDRNGDGKIAKDEAPEPMKEPFAMLDTNGDGFVTREEFRAGSSETIERGRERRPDADRDQPKRD